MEAKIKEISELSKLLSVKTRMSDDLSHLFGKFGISHLLSRLLLGSSEIWSDKLSLLHIKVTQRGGEHGGENIKTISRRCRRHKERQSRSVRVADNFGNKQINVLRNLANHCFVMK